MIDIKKIIDNTDEVINNLNKRNKDYSSDIKEIKENYEQYLKLLQEQEDLKHKINISSKKIGEKKRNGEDVKPILDEIEEIKNRLKKIDINTYKNKYEEKLATIPNLIASDVPEGQDEEDNEEIRIVGDIPQFNFKAKEHFEVEEAAQNFHFQKASKITKSRFVLTTSFLAKLERAIANFMLDSHSKKGYTEISVPFITSADSLYNSGQLPKFKFDLFKLDNNSKNNNDDDEVAKSEKDFYLIPTAEVILANIHAGDIIKEELPLNYTAYSQCFRKEVGSAGRDVSGIIRMHQFGKVELFKYVKPENSDQQLESMVSDAEQILKDLELPYRVVKLCSGDIGFGAYRTYDLEVWFPGQNKYRECSSCSSVRDFQSRRGKIRAKDENGNTYFPHMLNGSGMATGRILAAIIENYQQEDGTIKIPEKLKPYMDK